MRSIPVTRAREQLYRLLDEVAESSEPVQIQGPRADAVLVSAEDWRAIQETLYLASIPGMRESIVEGMKAPSTDFDEDPGWSDAGS
jgi:prevent-host-death family protein